MHLLCVVLFALAQTRVRTASYGQSCLEHTDCGTSQGMYCSSLRVCRCFPTYTLVGSICEKKINPDESGCYNSQQCSAVWPGAYCSNGKCKCPSGNVAWPTREGKVCIAYGRCPLGGDAGKLRESGTVVTCRLADATSMGGDVNTIDDSNCPETYECVCGGSGWSDNNYVTVFSTTQRRIACGESEATFCCPTRAFTCILNKDSGYGSSGSGTYYYYNPASGTCETFYYSGGGGNSNRFSTIEHCESYCISRCSRGPPQYSSDTSCPYAGVAPYHVRCSDGAKVCSTTSDCGSDYTCETYGASYCCPTPDSLCTATGQVTYESEMDSSRSTATSSAGYDIGIAANSDRDYSTTRYYWDTSSKRCRAFSWNQQAGNYNNFISEEDCNDFCSTVLCTQGYPLKDNTGLYNINCGSGSSTGCPSTYSCTSDYVCCPLQQTVCSQSKSLGSCSNVVKRWWYNAATSNCEWFYWSGCEGNGNNFKTQVDCLSYCQGASVKPSCPQGEPYRYSSSGEYYACNPNTGSTCPYGYYCYYDGSNYGCCATKDYLCSLSSDSGSVCGPVVTRWYYSTTDSKCEAFSYLGCDGNPNNFGTQTDCSSYCTQGGCPDGGTPYKETTGGYRDCTSYSCPSAYSCTSVTTGSTSYAYANYCCPKKEYVCTMTKDYGNQCADPAVTRYYFNSVTSLCEAFLYQGCGGNANSFTTETACKNYCDQSSCPSGTIVLYTNGVLATCSTGTSSSCPTNYNCVYSTVLAKSVCCGSPSSTGVCPSGTSAYYDSTTNQARQCTYGVGGTCPSGFNCIYSTTYTSWYCCGTASGTQCPSGGSAYMVSGVAQQCTPGLANACPSGYVCDQTTIYVNNVPSITGYCCGTTDVCTQGGTPQYVNNAPLQCVMGSTTICGSGYTCQYSFSKSTYYCCTTTGMNVCGIGTPYILDSKPVVCSSGSAMTSCPSPYTCQLYTGNNGYYCCKAGGTGSDGGTYCPAGLVPTKSSASTASYQYCSPNEANPACPSGSYCQYVETLARFICCGSTSTSSTSGCPNNAAVQVIAGSASPKACTTVGSSAECGSGFYCAFNSVFSQNVCCAGSGTVIVNPTTVTPTGDAYGCPTGTTYLYPSSQLPLQCFIGNTPCPAGYTCMKSVKFSGYQCCSGAVNDAPVVSATITVTSPSTSAMSLGSTGCTTDAQCRVTDPYAHCSGSRCVCASNLVAYQNRCVTSCPYPTMNISGVCGTSKTSKR